MKASVVITTFNSENFILNTLKSISLQTEKDFEVIIINNGSNDKTAELIKNYKKKDKRIFLKTKENEGMGVALNLAISLSNTNIIIRMDDDDIMDPKRIERQLDFLSKNKEISFSSCFYRLIDSKDKVIGKKRSELITLKAVNKKIKDDIVFGILHPGAVFYKDVFLSVGGYRPEFWPCEDIDLWVRFIDSGYKLKVQQEYLMKYRLHNRSTSLKNFHNNELQLKWVKCCAIARRNNIKEPNKEEFLKSYIPKNFFLKINFYRKQYSKYNFFLGKNKYINKSYFSFIFFMVITFLLNPFFIVNKIKICRYF